MLDVGVAGRGPYIGMTEQLLDGDEVNALFQQVGCEAMAERVDTGWFNDTGFFLAARNAT